MAHGFYGLGTDLRFISKKKAHGFNGLDRNSRQHGFHFKSNCYKLLNFIKRFTTNLKKNNPYSPPLRSNPYNPWSNKVLNNKLKGISLNKQKWVADMFFFTI